MNSNEASQQLADNSGGFVLNLNLPTWKSFDPLNKEEELPSKLKEKKQQRTLYIGAAILLIVVLANILIKRKKP